MFISPLRRYSMLCMLVLLVALIAGVWYITNPKRISLMAEVLLSAVLRAEAHVETGRLSFAGTLQLTHVELKTTNAGGAQFDLFSAEQVEVRFEWLTLLTGQLRATQITAVRPTLYLIEDRATNRWNYEYLQKAPGPGGSASLSTASTMITAVPVIVLREARVQWAERQGGVQTSTAGAIIDGQLAPDPRAPLVYMFQMVQHPQGTRRGTVITGRWDVANNTFSAGTAAIDLATLDLASLPQPVRQWWREHDLTGRVAALRITLDRESGLNLFIDLQNVALVQALESTGVAGTPARKINFQNVAGALAFNVTHPHLRVTGLSGRVLGYAFNLDAEFDGLSPDAPFTALLRLPGAQVTRDYPALINDYAGAADVVRRLRPAGLMDINLGIRRQRWNGHVALSGQVLCRDVAARFAHFPYPLEHVHGTVNLEDDYITIPRLDADADETHLVISGYSGIVSENQKLDILVESAHAVFDARMQACLPTNMQEIWALFAPEGSGRLTCHVTRFPQESRPLDVQVTVEPQDMQAMYRDFPYPFRHLRGKVQFSADRTVISGLDAVCGIDGSGRVHFAGTVEHGAGHPPQPQVTIAAEHVPVDVALLAALPADYQPWLRKATLAGRLEMAGRIAPDARQETAITGTVTLTDGALKLKDRDYAFDQVSATLELQPDVIAVPRLVMRPVTAPAAVIQLAGELRETPRAVQVNTQGRVTGLPILPAPPPGLPRLWGQKWMQYKPAGTLDGDFTLGFVFPKDLEGPGAMAGGHGAPTEYLRTYALHLFPQNLALRPAGWPEGLTGIQGQIGITPERIEFTGLTGQAGAVGLEAMGCYLPGRGSLLLALDAQAAVLPTKWFALLPESFRNTLASLQPQASWVAHLPHVACESSGGKPLWHFDGQVDLAGCSLQGPLPARMEHLVLSGSGNLDPATAGLDFKGDLSAKSLVVSGRPLAVVHADILALAGNKTLAFTNINGAVAGGMLDGNIIVHLDRDARYEATMVLSDADVGTLALGAKATSAERRKLGTGRLTATLNLQQQFGPFADRTGRGDLVVHDGQLFHVPLAMGLMEIATLRFPVAGTFHDATMSYYLRDNKITFEKILFESPGINLAGVGTLALQKRELDLNFVTESPHEMDWPILRDLTNLIRDQLLQISVTGPVDNPQITPVPLNALTTSVRDLLPKLKPVPKTPAP